MANSVARTSALWGSDSIIISVDQSGLLWLSRSFRQLPLSGFTIGDGPVIESDGLCVIQVLGADQNRSSAVTETDSHRYVWHITDQDARYCADVMDAMLVENEPSHQYIDFTQPNSLVICISTQEYDDDAIRDMRTTYPGIRQEGLS